IQGNEDLRCSATENLGSCVTYMRKSLKTFEQPVSRSWTMRKPCMLAGTIGLMALAAVLLLSKPGDSPARDENRTSAKSEAGKSPTAAQLPIAQVVLFSSGVGYFQREGQVDGDQRIDLTFPTSDINDLIKSLTLRDLDGGRIAAVSYDGN